MNESVVTYAEVRQWIVWLRAFTPSELADVMAVDVSVAQRFIRAAEWHGIIEDTQIRLNGIGPEEALYRWKPLPRGPREHITLAPEWHPVTTPGCYDLAPRNRGVPVRLAKQDRKGMSTSGQRLQYKLREKRYEAMQAAVKKRQEELRNKRIKKESYLDD